MARFARMLTLAVTLVGLTVPASGCTGTAPLDAATLPSPTPTSSAPSDVITFEGLPGLPLGATLASLEAGGLVSTAEPGCGPQFVGRTSASPVFAEGKLVLIWAYPPLRTPEGIMVGSTLAQARAAYPGALELVRPSGATEYPGILVRGGTDRAYLLLHDAGEIQKLIVGYESAAQQLFDTGVGTC